MTRRSACARKTEWQSLGGDAVLPAWASAVLTTSADELGLLEVRELTCARAREAGASWPNSACANDFSPRCSTG